MNRKGFAITAVLYSILIIFILLITFFLKLLSNKINFVISNSNTLESAYEMSSNYSICSSLSEEYVTIYRGLYKISTSSYNGYLYLPANSKIKSNNDSSILVNNEVVSFSSNSNSKYHFVNIQNNSDYSYEGGSCDLSGSAVVYVKTSIKELEIKDKNLDTSGANKPVLADGMIPVKWDGTDWVKADVKNSNENYRWYNYDEKEWANAVMVRTSRNSRVNDSKTRDTYMEAAPGTKIYMGDVLGFFVWIPRYKYQLFNVTGKANTSPQTIKIIFQAMDDTKENGTSNGEYLTHPAFSYSNDDGTTTELNGIWFGKFETYYSTTPLIRPGLVSRFTRSSLADPAFNLKGGYEAALKFSSNDYLTEEGTLQVDAHLIKNMDWGAVAYLSQSVYGINGEVALNSNTDAYTGGGSGDAYVNNVNQSTTGNVYGIYDMVGGMYDYVMGNYNGYTGDSAFDYSFLQSIKNRYIDIYTNYEPNKLGDATFETKGWYNAGYTQSLNSRYWLARGGHVYIGNIYSNYHIGIFDYEAYDGGQSMATSSCSGTSECQGYGSGQAGFRVALWNNQ